MKDIFLNIRSVFSSIFSDSSIVSLFVLATVFYSFFYTAAYDAQVASNLSVAVVDLDHSAHSRQMIRVINSHQLIVLDEFPQDLLAAETLLNRGFVDGIVLIPAGYEKSLLSMRPATLSIYSNGAYAIRNSTVLKSLVAVVQAEAERLIKANLLKMGQGIAVEKTMKSLLPVNLIMRPLFNTRDGYGSYVVVGVGQLVVQQTLMFGIVALLGRRHFVSLKERGDTTGKSMSCSYFCAAIVAFFLIGLANILYFNGFVFWFQDYPRASNLLGMLVFSVFFILAVVLFSMFIASFFDRTYRALQILGASSAPIFFLSGLPWPQRDLPAILYWPSQLLPTTAGINGFIKLNQMEASLFDVSPELLGLIFIILLFGFGAWWRWVNPRACPKPTR